MPGTRTFIAVLICAVTATACASSTTQTTASQAPSESQSAVPEKSPQPVLPTSTAAEPATPSNPGSPGPAEPGGVKSELPTEPSPLPAADSGVVDLSAVALPLQPPEGGFDEGTILLQEDFQTTTPAVQPFDSEFGSGGIGSLGDSRYYEMVITQPDGRLAAPITGLDPAASQQVYVQSVSFLTSFDGLASMDRGVYCWAANQDDPLSGARYEATLHSDGQLQVLRYDQEGNPAALLINQTFDFQAANAANPDAPDAASSATRIGILCRPDSEGRAQVAIRVDSTYYVTTDADTLAQGGGIGLIIGGRGRRASVDTIATFDGIFVLDGSQVPLR